MIVISSHEQAVLSTFFYFIRQSCHKSPFRIMHTHNFNLTRKHNDSSIIDLLIKKCLLTIHIQVFQSRLLLSISKLKNPIIIVLLQAKTQVTQSYLKAQRYSFLAINLSNPSKQIPSYIKNLNKKFNFFYSLTPTNQPYES